MKNKIVWLVILSINFLVAKNLGHRLGGDIYKPENTLYAYKRVIKSFIDKKEFKDVEFDVRETKDNKLVVFHDSKISRVVPKSKHNLQVLKNILKKKSFDEIRIKDLTQDELSKLNLAYNAKIPTLKEVLDVSTKWHVKKPIHVEIKSLHSDKARYDLIKTASLYKKNLDISFLAFRKNFYNSFPLPQRWVKLFQKEGLKVYQIDKYEFTKEISTKSNYTTLLPEVSFIINKKHRTNQFIFFLPENIKNKSIIKIGIFNGFDNSGDGGVNFILKNREGKILASGFSNSKNWEWFEVTNIKDKQLVLIIKDYDTDLTGEKAGNGGKVKVLLEIK